MAEAMIVDRRQPAAGDSSKHPVSLELSFLGRVPPKPGTLILTLHRGDETLKVYFDSHRCYVLSSD